MKLSNEIMYNASFNKDAAFQKAFWMGKKLQVFFADQLCTARKPKPENVEFFQQYQDAILKVIALVKYVNH